MTGKGEKGWAGHRGRATILFLSAALLFTIFIFKHQDHRSWFVYESLARFEMDFPFQFRVFFPSIANALRWMLPFLNLEGSYYFLTFLTAFGLLLAFRKYLGLFSTRVGPLVPMLILYPILWNHAVIHRLFMPSDLVSLVIVIVGLILIYRKNWLYFYPLFTLAILNRETVIYLTLAMIFTSRGRMTAKSVVLHALTQVCIWITVKYVLLVVFSSGMGGLYLGTLDWNIQYLKSVVTFRDGAFLWLTLFGLVWIPGLVRWRSLPVFVRMQFPVLIPAFLALFIAGGIDEIRIFTDLVVIVTTPTALLLLDRAGRPPARA